MLYSVHMQLISELIGISNPERWRRMWVASFDLEHWWSWTWNIQWCSVHLTAWYNTQYSLLYLCRMSQTFAFAAIARCCDHLGGIATSVTSFVGNTSGWSAFMLNRKKHKIVIFLWKDRYSLICISKYICDLLKKTSCNLTHKSIYSWKDTISCGLNTITIVERFIFKPCIRNGQRCLGIAVLLSSSSKMLI